MTAHNQGSLLNKYSVFFNPNKNFLLQRIVLSLTAFFFCVVLLTLYGFDRADLDNRLGIRQLPLPANWYYMTQPAGFTIGTAPEADDPRWIRLDSPRPLPGVTPPAAVLIRADIEAFPEWADSLYIPLLFEVFELYADGRMLYSHGDPGRKTSDWFQGWPWHIIPVSPAAGVRTLLFRVYSEHPKTGLVSTPLIGTTHHICWPLSATASGPTPSRWCSFCWHSSWPCFF